MKNTFLLAISSFVLVAGACSKKDGGTTKEAPATTASSTAPTTSAAPPAAPAAASPTADIDLSKAGAAWKGFHLKGLAGAEVTDNGVGGAVVNFSDSTMLQLNPADNRDVKTLKQALAASAKSVTYAVDTKDELSYKTVTDMGGAPITGYGFSVVVTAGGKKVECGSTYDDEATANRMKDVCKSLAK